jgi:hypothetical protein
LRAGREAIRREGGRAIYVVADVSNADGTNWKGRTSAVTWAEMRPAAVVAGLVALMVGAFALANRVSPFE